TIGHRRMADLTHAMESVLDDVRKGSLAVTTPVVDALFACIDALQMLNDEITTREPSDVAVEELAAHLHAVAGAKPVYEANVAQATAKAGRGAGAVELAVTIDPASAWPAVRAYQALMELAALGTVRSSEPSEEQLQAGESGYGLLVVLATDKEPAALERAVRSVPEIVDVHVGGAEAASALA